MKFFSPEISELKHLGVPYLHFEFDFFKEKGIYAVNYFKTLMFYMVFL